MVNPMHVPTTKPPETWGAWAKRKVVASLPKRRTVMRAGLASLLLMGPFLMLVTVKAWRVMVPFWVVVCIACAKLGFGADVAKQVRWFKRTSSNGPIFWAAAALERLSVRVMRRLRGDRMNVKPLDPVAVGLSARSSKSATVKWLPKPASRFSVERYEVQLRVTDAAVIELVGAEQPELADWLSIEAELEPSQLKLAPLQPDTGYEARVRAHNSAGASEWLSVAFRTKQAPVEGGGFGAGYMWKQHLKDETVTVIVPVPSDTRSKQLDVSVRPRSLRVALDGRAMVEGELVAPVKSGEAEWELLAAADGGKEVVITVLKEKKDEPFWPSLLVGGPEVDTRELKRAEKDLNELLAEHDMGQMMGEMAQMKQDPAFEELKKNM